MVFMLNVNPSAPRPAGGAWDRRSGQLLNLEKFASLSYFDINQIRRKGRLSVLHMLQRRCAFVFIGGIQPRRVKVDDQPRTCPKCGLPSARLKRLDHYLSLFFIPLIPIKRGEHFLECNRCGGVFDENGRPQSDPFQYKPIRSCPKCGREMAQDFMFCPHCGQRIS
jgi:hypothetical protein